MAAQVRPLEESPPAHLPPEEAGRCPNCEAPTSGNFCATCGQSTRNLRPTMRELLRDITRYVFRIDGKFLLTLRRLFLPGRLTQEYLAGRRERYERPFRFYLVINVAFFLVLGATRASAFDVNASANLVTSFTKMAERFDREQAERAAAGQPLRDEPRPIRFARNVSKMSPEQLQERLHGEYQRWGPKVFLAIIPVTAAFLTLLYRRRGMNFAEHFVFCLHYQAFSTLVTLPAQISGSMVAIGVSGVVDAGYLLLAMRAVYGDGWWSTAWRFLFVYVAAALTMGLFSTGLILASVIAGA